MKSKHGRPTKCTDELLTKAKQYLLDWDTKLNEAIPSIASLAVYLGISRESCMEWKRNPNANENYSHFAYIIQNIMALQEATLLTNGLKGSYNSTITKLILSKHGYSDKIDNSNINTTSGKIDVNISYD